MIEFYCSEVESRDYKKAKQKRLLQQLLPLLSVLVTTERGNLSITCKLIHFQCQHTVLLYTLYGLAKKETKEICPTSWQLHSKHKEHNSDNHLQTYEIGTIKRQSKNPLLPFITLSSCVKSIHTNQVDFSDTGVSFNTYVHLHCCFLLMYGSA